MTENKDEEEIKSKIMLVDKQINEDLSLIPEYKLLLVYSKLSKLINNDDRKYLILRNKFIFIDKTLTGYINLKDFYDILNNNLPLEKDELKILLCDPALRSKINPNLYQYKPFFDLVRHFKETDLLKMKQEYNQEQNPYIIKLKDEIKSKKVELNQLWLNVYKNGIKCTKENFNLLFVELKPNYNFHKLEIEYIFYIICNIGEDNIKYEHFRAIMKKKYAEDIRIIYFKGLKEFRKKEKEKKEENENLLINYYPNVLENNNTQTENNDENTKYLVIKGENIINKKEENKSNNTNINNKENFILGNIQTKSNDNTENIHNLKNIQERNINSISGTLDISESLAIKAKPKDKENETLKENNSELKIRDKILYKKYCPKIYNVRKENEEKLKKTYNESLKESKKFERNGVFENKIKSSNDKINNLLSKHEEYLILKLYLSLKNQFNLLNEDVLSIFVKKAPQNSKYLSSNDFISIMKAELKLNFIQDELIILLNSLENKDDKNNLFSYEEFINNVKNVSEKYKEKIDAIKNLAIINFNDYFVELKKFIINKNIDINEAFIGFSRDKVNLSLNDFIFLLKSFNYELDSNFEYNYIFTILSKHPEKKLLSKKDFFFFINSEIISEDIFINEGKIDNNFQRNHKKFWYKLIPKFDIKKGKIKDLKYFEQFFKQINNQIIKFGINKLADLFSSIYEINIDGNIKKMDFINVMKILEINNSQSINDLLIYFEDSYDKNQFQLFNFLGIFESFESKQKNIDNPPSNFKIYPKNPNIIFKNNYGFFTSLDIAKIKAFCLSINEKIMLIKGQNINEYFLKFDIFQNGFFTLEQLKTILIDDLNINKYDLIELFLSYILDNTKQNDFYTIQFKKLIDVINQFIENKTEDEQINLSQTFNYTNEIFNKLMNSTIMNIRLNKKEGPNYYFSPNAGID